MQENFDLNQVKKKVYLSYFQDGLWDILLGLYLIGWGLSIWQNLVAVMGGMWVVVYFAVLGIKRAVVYPRSGYIKLNEARKQQMRMVILGVVLFLMGFAVFGIFAFTTRPAWLDEYFMFLLISMMAVVIAILGYWWRVTRWYIYGVIVFAGAAAQQWLNMPRELAFFIPGGTIALYGTGLFIRFLRRYPKPSREEQDVIS
ncbi:MAG: hypothetical protein JSU79_08960 [Dehalococcoidales bacterium]|nr:MAG: hypothetical protein JSU79_08960 [Dehalococcoidales bacterium]